MKILHVESGMHMYGGALQVLFLLKGLREQGITNVLACPVESAIAREAQAHADVHPMPMAGDLDLGMIGRVRALIKRVRPDVIHIHSRRGSDIWAALAGRLEGVPVILCRRVDNPEHRWVVSLKYKLYDEVITISQGISRVLISEGVPPEKIHCVVDAVDTDKFACDRSRLTWFQSLFQLRPTHLTIGMVAQFITRKGHQVLLDAVPGVVARHPEVRFLLFGQGPLKAVIESQVQSSTVLSKHVLLPGFRNDLDQIMPCLDLLVHPAFMEGMGVALLQAAASGLPLIGTRVGGIPEVITPGVNGELFEPGDVSTLTKHINRLLDDPVLRHAYGEAGRRIATEHFSIAAMVSATCLIYQRIAATADK
jgi:glycosyltransferase involved in cell wall biosynthesis